MSNSLIPRGTSDTARTLLAGPSSAELAAYAGMEIEGAEPGGASVVLWQDKSTCDRVSYGPHSKIRLLLHEITEQDLGVQRTTWICKFDMRHTVDSSFFQDGKSSPVVVDVRLQYSWWRFGG